MIKLKLKETDENIQLLKDMASNDVTVRAPASEAFAEFVRDPILDVIQQASVWGAIYKDFPFSKYDGMQTIPLDDFFDVKEVDYVRVWSSGPQAGGLPTQQGHGIGEMPFTTYQLDSAISFQQRQLRHGRIDHVSRQLNRMAQEFLVKQERNRALMLLTALAKAQTQVFAGTGGGNPNTYNHVIRSYTANQFNLQDYNRLRTLHKRIMSSWAGGTPAVDQGTGLTDLYVSPEIVEFFRNLAFEPLNQRAGVLSGTSSAGYTSTAIPAPERVREAIYETSGVPSFFGVAVHETNELGLAYKLNSVFATVAGSTNFGNYGDGTAASTFASASEELVVGVNSAMDSFLRPVAVDADTGSALTTFPDDSLFKRNEVMGFFAKLSEGNVILDPRALIGLIV